MAAVCLAFSDPAGADVVNTFEGCNQGQAVTNACTTGIDWSKGPYAGSTARPTRVNNAGVLARSGTNVLNIGPCPEVCFSSRAYGAFTDLHKQVTVYVGTSGAAGSVRLRAYGTGSDGQGNKNVLQTTPAVSVTPGQPFTTPLTISRTNFDIAYFEVFEVSNKDSVKIDDLTVDDGDPAAVPEFSLSVGGGLDANQILGLRPGMTRKVKIDVDKFGGANGNLDFSVSGAPSGVSATVSPDPSPAGTSSVDVTVTAGASAKSATAAPLNITATPLSAQAGPAPRSVQIPVTVRPNFAVENTSFDIAGCGPTSGGKLRIYIPEVFGSEVSPGFVPSSFKGPVSLEVVSLNGTGVSLNPKSVSLQDGVATVDVRADPDQPFSADRKVTIKGTAGSESETGELTVRPVRPEVTAVEPNSARPPQRLKQGQVVTVKGCGFRPGMKFLFGQSSLMDGKPIELTPNENGAAMPSSVSSDGTSAAVRVPRLASTGVVVAETTVDGKVYRDRGSFFRVASYRNTNGFRFNNYPVDDVDWANLVQLYGHDQMYITVPVCYPLPIPCVPEEIRDPFANMLYLPILELALPLLGSGHCFGMSLASQRFLKGQQPFSPYSPIGADTIFELAGRETPPAALDKYLTSQHIAQTSAEFLRFWRDEVIINNSASANGILGDVEEALKDGEYPLVSMAYEGEGHVVVAYDVEYVNQPPIKAYIRVYDSNKEFLPDSEDTRQEVHKEREELGRITIYSQETAGRDWKFDALEDDRIKIPWGGGFDQLVVTPASAIPNPPTVPTSIEGLLMQVGFGASTETTSITDGQGSARAAQRPGGPRAVPFTFLDSDMPPTNTYVVSGGAPFTQKVRGTRTGSYPVSVFGPGFGISARSVATAPGVEDTFEINRNGGGLSFASGSPQKSFAPTLAKRASDGAMRAARIATTAFGGGREAISLGPAADTLTYTHRGPATSFSVKLGNIGGRSLPTAFESGPLSIGPGETISMRPRDWRRLDARPVEVTVTGADGSRSTRLLHSQGKKVKAIRKIGLGVKRKGRSQVVSLRGTFGALPPDAQVTVTLRAFSGKRVAARRTFELTGRQAGRRSRTLQTSFKLRKRGSYRLVGSAVVVDRGAFGSSQVRAAAKTFRVS